MNARTSASKWLVLIFLLAIALVACGPATTEEMTPPAEGDEIVAAETTPADTTETDEAEANASEAEGSEAEGSEADASEAEGSETEAPSTGDESATGETEGEFDIYDGGSEADFETTGSGLKYRILSEGDGPMPEPGQMVSVQYTGRLEDGTVFDSSEGRGTPFTFSLGNGEVIAGWDEGIALMHQGDKARLIIPPELGYGEAGAGGGAIPANATLVFDVELVDINEGPPEAPTAVDEEDYTTTDSGLKYYDLVEGEGALPEEGQVVQFNYTGWLEDGTRFDSSLLRGEPASYPLGSGRAIPGWDEGLSTMKVGTVRQLVIPPELAYGAEGAGGVIPPDATIILELELLDILPGGPDEPTAVDESDFTTTDSGLKYYDLVEGDGPAVEAGQQITVQYTGWLEDGTKIDSSYYRGEPATMVIGTGAVLPGWDEGIVGMKVGGSRQLVIPPELAYGAEGAGDIIPPDTTLIFEIEVLEAE